MLTSPRSRAFPLAAVALSLGLGLASHDARALVLVTSHPDAAPSRLRVAMALGPTRSTLWAQAHMLGGRGAAALIVPARPGASLDLATEAWFEALEVATAKRVLSPEGHSATCAGTSEEPRVEVVGDLLHEAASPVHEVKVLSDTADLEQWAKSEGLEVEPALAAALVALEPMRFVALRTSTEDGATTTPTLRVTAPAHDPALPFVLTRAGTAPLDVTTFVIAEGRAGLANGTAATLDGAALAFDAALGESDYRARRSAALASPSHWLVEAAGHELFTTPLVPTNAHVVDALIPAYALRASVYLGGGFDLGACSAASTKAMALASPVAASCPRAELGVVDGGAGCAESVAAGEVDPSLFRCLPAADDLAVALGGMAPKDAWITRIALELEPHETGELTTAVATSGPSVSPVIVANSVDVSGCLDPSGSTTGASGGATSGGSPSGGTSGTTEVPVYEVHESCGHREAEVAYVLFVPEDEQAPDYYYYEDDACAGDTSGSYIAAESSGVDDLDSEGGATDTDADADASDGPMPDFSGSEDCSGESGESYDTASDACSGESGESYSTASEDCSGDSGDGYDTASDACSGGPSSDGSESLDGCDSSSSDSCLIAHRAGASHGKRHAGRLRLSPILMLALAIAAPLRRRTRPGCASARS